MKYMMDNGKKVSDMEKEYGREIRLIQPQASMTLMLEIGKMVKLMALEFILGLMAIAMKESGFNA